MKIFKAIFAAVLLTVSPMMSSAFADDKAVVQKFYDLLSNPSSEEHASEFKEVTVESWESIGNYSGVNKSREAFLAQVGGFGKALPDLNWAVQQMIQEGDQVVVRSRATGTPAGPFFGVDGKGKSFDILTIDIHTITNGKIVRTYHVEDWAGALQQLQGQ